MNENQRKNNNTIIIIEIIGRLKDKQPARFRAEFFSATA